ncbi:DNA replication protein [Paramixta manurensis]|uniref:DNA replication protein n=1 Tax=Paramixta manurensis TaxID=2740817 RepID=A0A6M8UB46_9GAMM|nr:DNA replication protein [Erwiniaceae bacterium PD-1]
MSNVTNLAVARQARRHQETPKPVGKGFALLHRKIMDVPFYKDPEAAHLWVHLLLRANHEQTLVSTDIGDVLCERGEFITGRNTLAFETGIEPDRVKSLLRKYTNLGMITTKSNNRFTILKVVKYDEYQQFSCPADVQPVSSGKPHQVRADEQQCPASVQPVSTDKELLNTNSISKDIECATHSQKSPEQKQRISCEEVWQCLKDELPEARGWRTLTDERRNLIRTFWGKANKIARDLDDGQPLTMEGFRGYLQYISRNCRWMLEDRPDQRTGQTWRRKKFDDFLKAKLYVEVREGDKDDR